MADDETWMKFTTLDPTKPFAVYVYEASYTDGSFQAFAAFGEKAIKTNPVSILCRLINPLFNLIGSFPLYNLMGPRLKFLSL